MPEQFHPALSEVIVEFQKHPTEFNAERTIHLLTPFLDVSDAMLQSQANNFMGLIYLNQKKYSNAIVYFQKACDKSDSEMFCNGAVLFSQSSLGGVKNQYQ